MSEAGKCEYCGRPIKGEPEIVVRRGKKHIYCSDAPTITYEDLQKMYELRCVSVKFD